MAELWRAGSSRALTVPVPVEDAPRWRLESDLLGASSTQVRAWALATVWKKKLPDRWWQQASSASVLRAGWAVTPRPVSNAERRSDAGMPPQG